MNLNVIGGTIRAARTVGKVVVRYSPEIMVAGGIIGGAATTVLACKKTRTYVFQKLEYDCSIGELDTMEKDIKSGEKTFRKEDGEEYTF